MKKILLLVCALPFLINAQNARMNIESKEKTTVQQLLKSQPAEKRNMATTHAGLKKSLTIEKPDRVRLKAGTAKSLPTEKSNQLRPFAGAVNILPDSVYTYYDEANTDLDSKTYFKYNEEGWPIEQITVSYWMTYDWELEDYVWQGHEYKDVYEYTADKGLMTLKITSYYLFEGEWKIQNEGISEYIFMESDFRKFFTNQKSFEMCLEAYVYGLNYYYCDESTDDGVFLMSRLKAVEFDAEGRPTVFENIWLDYDDDDKPIEIVYRLEAGYNDNGLRKILTIFDPTDDPDDPWVLSQTLEFFYNDELLLTKVVSTESDESRTYEYEYNDSGQLIKESSLFGDDSDIFEYKYDEQGNLIYMLNYWEFFYYDEEGEYYVLDGDYENFFVNYYPEGSANALIIAIQSAVYPNPVSDVLNVQIEGADNALITIVSLTGGKVLQQKTTQPVVSIPVQSLAKGYYFLTIQTGARTKTHKILIR